MRLDPDGHICGRPDCHKSHIDVSEAVEKLTEALAEDHAANYAPFDKDYPDRGEVATRYLVSTVRDYLRTVLFALTGNDPATLQNTLNSLVTSVTTTVGQLPAQAAAPKGP